MRGSRCCSECVACAHPPPVPRSGSPRPGAGLCGARSRCSALPPGAPVQSVWTCPTRRDGSSISRLGGLVAEGKELRLEPRGTRRCCFTGWLAVPGQTGAQGEPRRPEGLSAAGAGGGEAGAQRQKRCLQATSCHFVSFKRVAFPLSWSAVRGGGSSVSPCPAPPWPPSGQAARGCMGGPLGKDPASPSLHSPGVFLATSALGAQGLQAVQLICC